MTRHLFRAILLPAISFLVTAPLFAATDPCSVSVNTAQGAVIGKAETGGACAYKGIPEAGAMQECMANQGVCAYKGIPFAAAPKGQRRWRPPEPAPKREKVLEAFSFGPQCIQQGTGTGVPDPTAGKPVRDEDCLNLNIWRPAKSGTFPVMVWIHGGSLTGGSGSETLYWGDRLAAKGEVVVVTINYRLSFYGFLALPGLAKEDPNASAGNYGLLDQIAALTWVKENISGFGGDADNVTIFGESAGGWSVCNLLASPLAAGLFQKAILESGGCEVVKSLESGYKDGEKFAKSVGCEGGDAACLRDKSPADLYRLQEQYARKHKKDQNKESPLSLESMRFEWVPHLDGWALKETPLAALASGRFNQVPLMIGTNRDEVKLFTIAIPGVRLLPASVIRAPLAKAFGDQAARRIELLYPYAHYRRPLDAILDAAGDFALGCPCFFAAEAVAPFQPVYYYRFDFDRHLFPHLVGAAHGLEIPFIFDNLDRNPANIFLTKGLQKQAEKLAAPMMRYWVNFARSGNPNGEGLLPWPVYQPETRQRMVLDLPLRVEAADNVAKCAFWKEQNIKMAE